MKGDFSRWSFKPERHYHGVLEQQGRVNLDADWNEQGAIMAHRAETEAADVIGPSGAPAGNPGFQLTATTAPASLRISKGHAYVDGILCENEQDVLITAQPDLPSFPLPTTAGVYICYLDVWLRHVTALDDNGIREDALGGPGSPDTCTRAKTVWQVKMLQAGNVGANITCATSLPGWDSLTAPSSGTLAARSEPSPTTTGPCVVSIKAGFRRLENQLYRVEIHDPSGAAPTFKWSRDNGSVVTSWTAKNGNNLTVSSSGRDAVLGFAAGQWVELTDDNRELTFKPGTLVQLANVQGQTLTINPATATGSVNLADFPKNPKVRRWDSNGPIPLTTGGFLSLEDGVQVQFSSGTYATGDYWLIPARTLTANVDWPRDGGGNAIAQPPKGIRHHYCRLAVVQFDGTSWSVVMPCLPIFPPLTGITSAQEDKGIHITDVRTITPDSKLLNDSDVIMQEILRGGIRVLCDGPVSPVSAQPTTCFVTLELPWPISDPGQNITAVLGFRPLILPGSVQAVPGQGGSAIEWKLNSRATMDFLIVVLGRLRDLRLDDRILARLTLKGNFIWDQDPTPTLYLDGEAFGIARTGAGGNNIGLRLPQSGNGKRGGDFEMWFWLNLPAALGGLTIAPVSVNAGVNAVGTVTLTGPAPAGGALVNLAGVAIDAAGAVLPGVNVATVPASVTVPVGQTTATFNITNTHLVGSPTAIIASALLRVTASFAGVTATANLTITRQVVITGVNFGKTAVIGGTEAVIGTVTLNGPAGPNGEVVTLAGSHPGVPNTVTIPAGQTSATFEVRPAVLAANSQPVSVLVTAIHGGTTTPATFVVLPRA